MIRTGLTTDKSRVCLLLITDGRAECIEKTLLSWAEQLDGAFTDFIVVNDSGDMEYACWLDRKLPYFTRIHHPRRLGFGETIRDAWANIPGHCDFIFHLEDDFLLNRSFKLDDWIAVLKANPDVISITAYRQPWSQAEIFAGGFIPMRPGCYQDKKYVGDNDVEYDVIEHTNNFSTNPCLYPSWLTNIDWPESPESEGKFGFVLKELNPNSKYLLWGKTTDEPLVHHFGARKGTGY
jgi:hypothetical protein